MHALGWGCRCLLSVDIFFQGHRPRSAGSECAGIVKILGLSACRRNTLLVMMPKKRDCDKDHDSDQFPVKKAQRVGSGEHGMSAVTDVLFPPASADKMFYKGCAHGQHTEDASIEEGEQCPADKKSLAATRAYHSSDPPLEGESAIQEYNGLEQWFLGIPKHIQPHNAAPGQVSLQPGACARTEPSPIVIEWMKQYDNAAARGQTRFKPLLVDGETRLGMTQWAKSFYGTAETLVLDCHGLIQPPLLEFAKNPNTYACIIYNEASCQMVMSHKSIFTSRQEIHTLQRRLTDNQDYEVCVYAIPMIICTAAFGAGSRANSEENDWFIHNVIHHPLSLRVLTV